VLVIIAILTAIGLAVIGPAMNRARVRATESLIIRLMAELDLRMPAYASKQFQFNPQVAGWEASMALIPEQANVMAKIRHVAAAFPDTMNELCHGGTAAPAQDPIGKDDPAWQSYGNPKKHPWIATQRSNLMTFPPPAPADQNLDSAECLYLIITEGPNATPGFIDKIEPRFIKTDPNRIDANGEGLKYFADAWGNPIRFDRWAVTTTGNNGATPFQPVTLQYCSNWNPAARPKSNYDPNGLLLDCTWVKEPASSPTSTYNRNLFERWFLPILTNDVVAPTATPSPPCTPPLGGSGMRQPQGLSAVVVLTSAGPDGNMGLGGAPLSRSDGMGIPPIIKFDQPLDDGTGGITDNISSATLRIR